ncbi:MAG TPA: biotin-dependent carboxyltransferase family protein [Zoogloea sp.]|uniref:5-oxoprolinase subunit C family protein n=1 Tax=Zoogloea sp. TaxID=49181 RepID=UPI002D0446CF|nr:biotin-dependent carboxyltransferase family protein [Zoogloea sp.]HNI47334.1 biotin-dependent carboxyltransferase family protein [Zoogloea sp.]
MTHLHVLDGGLGVSVQDRGRVGYRALGVPVSGALDPLLLAAANALAGAPADAAALEILLHGPRLQAADGPVRVALAGAGASRVLRGDGSAEPLPPWRSATLTPGDILAVGRVEAGVAVLAVSGGMTVPVVLGSRATYARAGLGGIAGRPLQAGDRLPCGAAPDGPERVGRPWRLPAGPLRVIAGPQREHVDEACFAAFLAGPWTVTPAADRMGARLAGPRLTHSARGAEIVTDGVTPGAIQVPADGQPILLRADCQTTGGYPKIATVIAADLPRLGHLRPGDTLSFSAVDAAAAARARQEQARLFAAWRAALSALPPAGGFDATALYAANLVGGVLRGDED